MCHIPLSYVWMLDEEELSLHDVCVAVAVDCVVGGSVMMLDGLEAMVDEPSATLD